MFHNRNKNKLGWIDSIEIHKVPYKINKRTKQGNRLLDNRLKIRRWRTDKYL
jgi:hypothetical protein